MRMIILLKLLIGKIKTGSNYLQIGKILIQWGSKPLKCIGAETNMSRDCVHTAITFAKEYKEPPTAFTSTTYLSNYLAQSGADTITTKTMIVGCSHTRTQETTLYVRWLTIGEAK